MKALSIRQPWAWLIANGHKDIENRTWDTKFRGRFLIHASNSITRNEYSECAEIASSINKQIILPRFEQLERGGIVGEAELVDCVTSSASGWFYGPYGFAIERATPLPFFQHKGKLGFFEVEV